MAKEKEVLTKMIIDCATGQQNIVPLTAAEIAQRDQNIAAAKEAEAERQAEIDRLDALRESAKAKLVSGEPLTEEEAEVLLV